MSPLLPKGTKGLLPNLEEVVPQGLKPESLPDSDAWAEAQAYLEAASENISGERGLGILNAIALMALCPLDSLGCRTYVKPKV